MIVCGIQTVHVPTQVWVTPGSRSSWGRARALVETSTPSSTWSSGSKAESFLLLLQNTSETLRYLLTSLRHISAIDRPYIIDIFFLTSGRSDYPRLLGSTTLDLKRSGNQVADGHGTTSGGARRCLEVLTSSCKARGLGITKHADLRSALEKCVRDFYCISSNDKFIVTLTRITSLLLYHATNL